MQRQSSIEVAPRKTEALCDGQLVQESEPALVEYPLYGHLLLINIKLKSCIYMVQLTVPSPGAYVPGPHAVHTEAPYVLL